MAILCWAAKNSLRGTVVIEQLKNSQLQKGGGGEKYKPPQITTISNDDISVHFPPRLSFYDF